MRRKWVWIIMVLVIFLGGGYAAFLYFQPHRGMFSKIESQLDQAAPPEVSSKQDKVHSVEKRTPKSMSEINGQPSEGRKTTREFKFDAPNSDENYTVVRVFYATDRDKRPTTDPGELYGIDRSELTFGICEVSIPKDHRLGELEAPSIWKLEFTEDPEKHVVLLKVEEQDKEKYFQEISNRVRASSSKSTFLFVHGFNITFEYAARRTAQMVYDLNYDGAPVFYSWPSQGSSSSYTVDENNVDWTERHLEMFLTEFVERSNAEKIYLVAHSMGSRALTKAIAAVAEKDSSVKQKIEAIILAAPDIDADIFKERILPRIRPIARNLTLYASTRDRALIASKQVHGYARAGEVGPDLVVTKGIDTIDATSVDTSLIGHSYYAEAKSIVADLFEIFKYQRTASERLHLARKSSEKGELWVFEPSAKVLKIEPPVGGLSSGAVRYIDDGTCDAGLIKKIVEGDAVNSVPRRRSCVPN